MNTATFSVEQFAVFDRIARHVMPRDDTRYYLNGVLFRSCAYGLECIATDGHSLAAYRPGIEFHGHEFIVNANAIDAVLKRRTRAKTKAAPVSILYSRVRSEPHPIADVDIEFVPTKGPAVLLSDLNDITIREYYGPQKGAGRDVLGSIDGRYPDVDRVLQGAKGGAVVKGTQVPSSWLAEDVVERVKAVVGGIGMGWSVTLDDGKYSVPMIKGESDTLTVLAMGIRRQ